MEDKDGTLRSTSDSTVSLFSLVLVRFWLVSLGAVAVTLVMLTFSRDFSLVDTVDSAAAVMAILFALAFFAEYVDSSLGMGYGTTLTPVLLIMGFSPLQIVPAILFSEFISGISAGGLHHHIGNVNLNARTQAGKSMLILAGCSIVGTVAAVFFALSLPKMFVKLYIGVMILVVGLFIIFGNRVLGSFAWSKVIGLGTIAAFNKGISGGGYGPLVTGGQVMIGVPGKNAIGITLLAEGLVCFVGLILYVTFHGWPEWNLAIPLAMGAIISVPAATWTVKILPERSIRKYIGYATIFLGTLTLVKLWL
jgi:uncharacterized protein